MSSRSSKRARISPCTAAAASYVRLARSNERRTLRGSRKNSSDIRRMLSAIGHPHPLAADAAHVLLRADAELLEQPAIVVLGGIFGRQQPLAVEDRVRAGQEAERLRLVAHVAAAGRKADVRGRHQQPRHRDDAYEIQRLRLL